MSADWATATLGTVCEIYQPKSISQKEMSDDAEYPVFGANGQIGKYDKYNHEDPQLLITCRGATCGSVNISAPFSWITGNAMVVRPKEPNLDLNFVEYFFRGAVDLDGVITGAAQPQITRKSLAPVIIPVPPLEEQKRIVVVLDKAFAALDRARALAEANLADAEELFESSSTRVFFSKSDSHPLVQLSEIANLDRGQNPPKKDFIYKPKTGYVRFYQIRDRKSDKHAVYVPYNEKLHKVAPHEILMSAYRHIGEVFRGAEGAFNVALCKISSKSEERLLNDYLFEIIPTDLVKGELLRHSERSLIPSMSVKHLQTIEIPLPSISRQQAMVTELIGLKVRISKLREACRLKLNDLDDLRQSILQKAFAGELT